MYHKILWSRVLGYHSYAYTRDLYHHICLPLWLIDYSKSKPSQSKTYDGFFCVNIVILNYY